jgi:hypothetical protein
VLLLLPPLLLAGGFSLWLLHGRSGRQQQGRAAACAVLVHCLSLQLGGCILSSSRQLLQLRLLLRGN